MKLYENDRHLCNGMLSTSFLGMELYLFDAVHIDTSAEHYLEDEDGTKKPITITGIHFGPTFYGMRITVHFIYRS